MVVLKVNRCKYFGNIVKYIFLTMNTIYLTTTLLFYLVQAKDIPKFVGTESNVTVVVGRDATLTCKVENLLKYKVAWLKVDTQTILTIGPHVITKNHRVSISTQHSNHVWSLSLRDVRPADGGLYMCQINTEPMITQNHHLHILVPPDILDSGSGEIRVREGDNVSLHCAASGTPQPTVTWRREDSAPINIDGRNVSKWSGVWLNMSSVNRNMNGALLCIAINGVPPSVSKRIILHVLCKPSAWMTQKMVGAYIGETVFLKCQIEAKPQPIVYWTHIDDIKLENGSKYQASIKSEGYKYTASIQIKNISREDIGSYYCHAENSLGATFDGATLYTLATTTLISATTTQVSTTAPEVSSTLVQFYAELEVSSHNFGSQHPDEDTFLVVLSQQMQNLDISPSL